MAPKIGIALGGGGIRGFAHLGVLKVLKKQGIPINMVAGSSAGAIAASLVAVGADLDTVEQVLLSLNLKKLMNVGLHRTGFVDGNNLVETVRLLTKNKNIEDADIGLRIIATDLIKREIVEFDRGNIAEAVRASVAIPGIFTPVKRDGRVLVDGCVLNHCPDDVVKKMGADVVLAVDLEAAVSKEPANVFEVVLRSWELMSRGRLQSYADMVIYPIMEPVGQLDFSRCIDCLRMGEQAAESKVTEIKELIASYSFDPVPYS